MRPGYRFVLELHGDDRTVIHREALDPDWEPALEAARLTGLRARGIWPQIETGNSRLEPLWHEQAGKPTIRGFRVWVEHEGHAWFADFAAVKYFAEVARAAVASVLADPRLKLPGVRYSVAAYAVGDRPGAASLRFDARVRPQPLNVRQRDLVGLIARSQPYGDTDRSDFAVVLPTAVVEEVCRLTEDAGEQETGGVLIGHICRRDDYGDVGLEVTAQMPARHTVGDAVKLTFTSDTWTDARAAVALRKSGELLVGWWHSHPAHVWCKACPLERQRVCQFSEGFLSADDRALHRAMFPGAYTQALLITNSVKGLNTRLFGWKDGTLQARGFWLFGDAVADSIVMRSILAESPVAAAACVTSGETHAT